MIRFSHRGPERLLRGCRPGLTVRPQGTDAGRRPSSRVGTSQDSPNFLNQYGHARGRPRGGPRAPDLPNERGHGPLVRGRRPWTRLLVNPGRGTGAPTTPALAPGAPPVDPDWGGRDAGLPGRRASGPARAELERVGPGSHHASSAHRNPPQLAQCELSSTQSTSARFVRAQLAQCELR